MKGRLQMNDKQKKFKDLEIGDIAIVADEYAHDYTEHSIAIKSVEYDKEFVTPENPKGVVFFGRP